MSGICRLHDMPRHNCLQTVVNQVLVYLSKGGVPFLAAVVVYAVCNVLVTEIKSVSGEMLGRAAKAGVGVSAVHIGLCHFRHSLHVVAVGTEPDNRIFPVIQDIAYRGKGKVASDCRRFLVGHISQIISVLHIAGSADFRLVSDFRTVHAGAVPAVFRIAGYNQRNFAVLLQNAVLFINLVCRGGIVANASDMVFVHRHLQIILFPA